MKALLALALLTVIAPHARADEGIDAFEDAAAAKQWQRSCDGISDRGISSQKFDSLSACKRAAKRACSTLDGRVVTDADCVEAEE